MRHRLARLSFAATLAPLVAFGAPQAPSHSYMPAVGFVPDSATAVAIAVAIWTPIYGAREISAERPYVAHLRGDVWTVTGTLPRKVPGGVAVAEISKRDARILRVSHGR
jgi:hypothetical protein